MIVFDFAYSKLFDLLLNCYRSKYRIDLFFDQLRGIEVDRNLVFSTFVFFIKNIFLFRFITVGLRLLRQSRIIDFEPQNRQFEIYRAVQQQYPRKISSPYRYNFEGVRN